MKQREILNDEARNFRGIECSLLSCVYKRRLSGNVAAYCKEAASPRNNEAMAIVLGRRTEFRACPGVHRHNQRAIIGHLLRNCCPAVRNLRRYYSYCVKVLMRNGIMCRKPAMPVSERMTEAEVKVEAVISIMCAKRRHHL